MILKSIEYQHQYLNTHLMHMFQILFNENMCLLKNDWLYIDFSSKIKIYGDFMVLLLCTQHRDNKA